MRLNYPLFSIIALAFASAVSAAAPATEPVRPPTTTATTAASELPLTTTAAIRGLTPELAALKEPVRIRGVVTFVAPSPPIMFVQDETGGVCVSGPRDRELRPQIRPGAIVEVEGVTAAGRPAGYITNITREVIKVTVVGEGPIPTPRAVPLARLGDLEFAGSVVETSGVVRSVRTEPLGQGAIEVLIVTLASGRDRAEVAILGWPAIREIPKQWAGATVKLRGVFNASSPERMQVVAGRLLTLPKDVHTLQAATRPFELPITPLAAVASFPPEQPLPTRVRIAGVVTVPVPGKGAYVQQEGVGVWVETPGAELQPGSRVDLIGFPVRSREAPVALEDPQWRVTDTEPLPDAPLVTGEQAMGGELDARLVRMEALVLSVSRLSEGPTLVLQSGERVFLARAAAPTPGGMAGVAENSWVRVTGVCVNNRRPGWEESATPPRPVSFHLLLGTSGAVEVIHSPGWLTLGRTLLIAGGLAAVTLAAFAWVALLRRRVARQTHLIREHLARETLNEERMRIARELHDSLEQDLLGITMQLTATEKLLDEPQRAKQSLHLAAAMVRRSQSETHRAVWDLRARGTDSDGLVNTLRQAVAGLSPAAGPEVAVAVQGEEPPLPPQVENHLLRVALEAVTNAIKHAGASRIDVAVDFDETSVTVRVTDNGKGFDTDRLPLPSSGHFGLFGMKERAEKLRGQLTLASRAGQGSEIRLHVPLQTNGDGAR